MLASGLGESFARRESGDSQESETQHNQAARIARTNVRLVIRAAREVIAPHSFKLWKLPDKPCIQGKLYELLVWAPNSEPVPAFKSL